MVKKMHAVDESGLAPEDVENCIVLVKEKFLKKKAKHTVARPARKRGTARPTPTSCPKVTEAVQETNWTSPLVPTRILPDDPGKTPKGDAVEWTPEYTTEGAANADLRAIIPADLAGKREINLSYRTCLVVECGFSMRLPPGFKAEVSARSELASRGLVILNAPGPVNEDDHGRIKVILSNVGKEIIKIEHGDRIAQMWPTPVYRFAFEKVSHLDDASTGVE